MKTCAECKWGQKEAEKGCRRCVLCGARVEACDSCKDFAISARAYLERVGEAEKRIAEMQDRRRRYAELAGGATSSTEATRSGGTSGRSRVENYMVKAIDLDQQISREIDDLRRRYAIASEMIEDVSNAERRSALRLRYLDGVRDWDTIARRIGYEVRQVYRIRDGALHEVQRQMDRLGIRQ